VFSFAVLLLSSVCVRDLSLIHRRFIYKRDTSTHAQGTDPRGLWESKGSSLENI